MQNAVRAVTWVSLMINVAFWLFFSPSAGWRKATFGVLAALITVATAVSTMRAGTVAGTWVDAP